MSQSDTVSRAKRYADRLSEYVAASGSLPEAEVVSTLQKLEKLDINLKILTDTGIGKKVNELRKKSTDEKARKLCKSLIQKWKGLLEGNGKDSPGGDENSSSSPTVHAAPLSQQSDSQHSSGTNAVDSEESNDAVSKRVKPTVENGAESFSSSQQKAANGTATSQPTATVPSRSAYSITSVGGDPVRQGFRDMLLTSLRSHEPWPQDALDAVAIAADIEGHIREKVADDFKYKTKLRAKVKALRDSKNPALREMILTGQISAEKFCNMTAEEMASDEVKALRKKLNDEAITSHQLAVQQGTETDMFKCGKCKSSKCTYTQLQTRSSDEPMTTFVVCLSCGNRWKFC